MVVIMLAQAIAAGMALVPEPAQIHWLPHTWAFACVWVSSCCRPCAIASTAVHAQHLRMQRTYPARDSCSGSVTGCRGTSCFQTLRQWVCMQLLQM